MKLELVIDIGGKMKTLRIINTKFARASLVFLLAAMCFGVTFAAATPRPAEAITHRTVEYGASWSCGRDGLAVFSALFSSTRDHTATVVMGSSDDYKFANAGRMAHAQLWGIGAPSAYYYNIW
jgi:hypothetical protein